MESCMKEAGEAELLTYAKQCEEYLAFGESVDQLTDVLEAKEQNVNARGGFSVQNSGSFAKSGV